MKVLSTENETNRK